MAITTPHATLDYLYRYSLANPNEIPVECYTEEALLEMSGVMLQNLTMMSGLSQIRLQTGGMIGSKSDMPIVSGIATSFHLRVDALLKKHSWPTPPELSLNAFALLGKLTLGAALSNEETLLKPDRETFRLAAGILKSPKDFLSEVAKLIDALDENPSNTGSQKKEPKAPPKCEISINGDEATATAIIESDTFSVPTHFKLQRLNERWLVSQVFSDEILAQMLSSMSQSLGVMTAGEPQPAITSTSKLKSPGSLPRTPTLEMQERLQDDWDVKVMGFAADVSDKRPYQAVVRGQLFLLQCTEGDTVIGTSPWKMVWPDADRPDVVDIIWDPNNTRDGHAKE